MRDSGVLLPFDARLRLTPRRPGPHRRQLLVRSHGREDLLDVERCLNWAAERLALLDLPQPLDDDALTAWRVSQRVNAPQNQGPGLIDPA